MSQRSELLGVLGHPMLLIEHCYSIRSERRFCEELDPSLAYLELETSSLSNLDISVCPLQAADNSKAIKPEFRGGAALSGVFLLDEPALNPALSKCCTDRFS